MKESEFTLKEVEFAVRESEFAVKQSEFAVKQIEFDVKQIEFGVKEVEFAVTLLGHHTFAPLRSKFVPYRSRFVPWPLWATVINASAIFYSKPLHWYLRMTRNRVLCGLRSFHSLKAKFGFCLSDIGELYFGPRRRFIRRRSEITQVLTTSSMYDSRDKLLRLKLNSLLCAQ